MAYKISLRTFGKKPADLKVEYDAKIAAKEMTTAEAQEAATRELRENPYFDYRDIIAQILPEPIAGTGRGNSGADVRIINRITRLLDADKTADHILIEEIADYNFLAARTAAYAGWSDGRAAANLLIEQFLDDIAKAEKVSVVEKPKETAAADAS